jgi:hypothetical protein
VVFDKLVYVLIGLTILLLVATLVLSRNRRRTTLVLGLGVALAMVVANAVVSAIQDQVIGLVGGEAARKAAASTIDSLVSSLEVSTTTLSWLGLLVVVGAFVAGDSRTATGIRRAVASGATRARDAGSSVVTREGRSAAVAPLPTVANHLGAFRVGGVVAAMVWLIVIDITWVKLAFVLVVLLAYEVAITVLGRAVPAGPERTATSPPDVAA